MVNASFFLLSLPLLIAAAPLDNYTTFSNAQSSLRILYSDNLNHTDDANHIGFLLLDPVQLPDAQASCQSIGESLLSPATINANQADIARPLEYLSRVGDYPDGQNYWIANGTVTVDSNSRVKYVTLSKRWAFSKADGPSYPVLCTQSSTSTSRTITTQSKSVIVPSIPANENIYKGFITKKAFSFQGVRYAAQPARWTYSTPYTTKGRTFDATSYGSSCVGNEDCLFLNIQTPYLPKAESQGRLRPVLFWIHGGGFTGGKGSDQDGQDLAAKEDIVVVSINYRLSTLGFFAVPNTTVTGNYGIADQVTALDWVRTNIAAFGGDPTRITIAGESAGAGSVRVLLGSPKAIGKFAGGIAMSNLGGGVDLGLGGDYGTTYSSYLTEAESFSRAGTQIFAAAGCNQTSINAQIDCLRQVDSQKLVNFGTVARYVVQDGTYVNTENLHVVGRNNNTAYVPVIFGTTADDGASFSTYPKTPVTSEKQGIVAALGISNDYAQKIIDSGLFPYYDSGNITLDSFNVSQRIATDKTFRCVDEATVYAGATTGAFPRVYYYQMDRTIDGYDPNSLGGPKNDNPSNPYFRFHGADLPWMFGDLGRLRDANDLYSIQLSTSFFGAFIRTGLTTVDADLARALGYDQVADSIQQNGQWYEVTGQDGPIRRIDYSSRQDTFIDVPQCTFLNYTLNYYIDGGR